MKRFGSLLLVAIVVGYSLPARAASGVEDWVEILREEDEAAAQAAEVLLAQAGPSAVRPLQKVLDDANFKVRRRAAETLGKLGPAAKRAAPDLVERLLDPQYEVQTAARKALLQLGDDAIPALTDAAKSDQAGSRRVALETLSEAGPKGIPVILELLRKDENAFLRASAAEALGAAQPVTPEIIQSLTQALSDLQESVRGAASDALGKLGAFSRSAIKPLFTASRDDRDALVRRKASDALFEIAASTPEAATAVATEMGRLMSSADPAARRDAVSGFEKLGVAGLQGLISALSDRDNSVGEEAGNAIVRIGAAALPSLEALQKSSFPFLQRKADELIKRIQHPAGRRRRS